MTVSINPRWERGPVTEMRPSCRQPDRDSRLQHASNAAPRVHSVPAGRVPPSFPLVLRKGEEQIFN